MYRKREGQTNTWAVKFSARLFFRLQYFGENGFSHSSKKKALPTLLVCTLDFSFCLLYSKKFFEHCGSLSHLLLKTQLGAFFISYNTNAAKSMIKKLLFSKSIFLSFNKFKFQNRKICH